MAETLQGGVDRYRTLFHECPVALWEADLSTFVSALESPIDENAPDTRDSLARQPEDLLRPGKSIRIVAANRAALDLFEAPDLERLRAGLSAIFTRESLGTFGDIVTAFMHGERHFSAETAARTLGGKTIHIRMKGSILPGVEGKAARLLISAEDVTANQMIEENLKESENRFRSIFENARDGMLMLDADTRKQIEANDAICKMLGYSRDEILGLPVEALHPAGELPFVMDVLGRQIRGEDTLAPDIPMLRKDGSVFHADVNSVPLTLRGRQCLLGVFRDCTGRMKAEKELRENRNLLETIIEAAPT